METYCIFSAFYLPHLGGVENYTAHVAAALVDRGHKVIVATSRRKDEPVFEEAGGITIVRLTSVFLLGDRFPLPRKDADFHKAWRWLESASVDHVIVNTRFYPLSLRGLGFARERGIRPLVVEHGSSYLTAGRPVVDAFIHRYEDAVTAWGRRAAPRYYAVSEKSAAWLKHFNIEASGVLHNAINVDEFVSLASSRDFRTELSLGSNAFVLAFTGRLLVEKGVVKVCDAVERLAVETGADIHVLCAGDGPARGEVEKRVGRRVHVLGRLDAPDVSALLSCSQVFCFPTTYPEGFPTSLLEAAAHGKGIVVTDTGGARELIPDDRYGVVLPDASVDEVAKGVMRFYNDHDYLCSAGRLVRDRVDQLFSWDRVATDLVAACRADGSAGGKEG